MISTSVTVKVLTDAVLWGAYFILHVHLTFLATVEGRASILEEASINFLDAWGGVYYSGAPNIDQELIIAFIVPQIGNIV